MTTPPTELQRLNRRVTLAIACPLAVVILYMLTGGPLKQVPDVLLGIVLVGLELSGIVCSIRVIAAGKDAPRATGVLGLLLSFYAGWCLMGFFIISMMKGVRMGD